MRSMTGFGRGVAEHGKTRATVDVRAVNHRFLDIKLRGAQVGPALEDAITARVRGSVERGALTVSLHLARLGAGAGPRIDATAAREAHDALSQLARTLGVAGPDLALVLAQPGVVSGVEPDSDDDDGRDPAVLAALAAALVQLAGMRDHEGGELATEIGGRLGELERLGARISEHADDLPQQTRKKLAERVRKLFRDEALDKASDAAGWLDPGRLAQEVAILADRSDITEEMVRLDSHLKQARGLVTTAGASGRRLDFLVQELGRELNTIGSKAAIADISSAIVEAKAVLEKVREQVQNVE